MKPVPSSNMRHIAIEGPIGVGKTTLSRAVQEWLGARLLLEEFEENPFLPLLYRDYQQYALQTELFFLLRRKHQNQRFFSSLPSDATVVSDYMFDKCRVFAKLTLPPQEFELFAEVYDLVRPLIPQPDLIVYLDAPVPTLLERINQRGRQLENAMSPDYLERLRAGYQEELERSGTKVVRIDTTKMDLRTSENFAQLQEIILGLRQNKFV
jgi:deoxyguanosine kinase